jgi:hypothetical protein
MAMSELMTDGCVCHPKGATMKFLISVILILALTSVSTCRDATRVVQSASEDNSKEKVTIYYARVSCPTGCPAFSLTIRPDRSVEYEGKEFARLQGKRTYTISVAAYKAILDAVRRARVERLADEYKPVPGRDAGTAILRFTWNGKTKEIIHFLPSPDAPEELGELEEAIVQNAWPSEGRVNIR